MTNGPKIEVSTYQQEDGYIEVIGAKIVLNVKGQNQYASLDEQFVENLSATEISDFISYWKEVAEDNGLDFEEDSIEGWEH